MGFTLPTDGATGWGAQIRGAIDGLTAGGYYLDSYTGTDDQRLTAAIADQQANTGGTNMAPIILPARPLSFTTPRTLYSGCKIIGAHRTGQKNPELSSGTYVGPEITLGGSITSGTSSWWNGTGSIYDVYMADFSVQGSSGASTHQFMDLPVSSGTLYACEFHALSFNFMRAVFGRKDRVMGFTQVILTGSWTLQNLWDTQLSVGGSDCALWMGGYVNMGPSGSAAQTGTLADSDYELLFSNLSNTDCGYIYCTVLNGWRGLRQVGNNSSINYFGGVYEGYKSTRQNGLLSGPAPGTVIRIDAGAANFYGSRIGQGMDNPDATEDGLVQVNGGEVNLNGCNFYGANMGTTHTVDHNGGRLLVLGANWRDQTSQSGRPLVSTTATAGTGDTAFYSPDQSVTTV